MSAFKAFIFSLLTVFLSGCATLKDTSTLQRMALAGAAGYLAGQTRNQNKDAYGLMYAGLAASAVGAYSAYQDSEQFTARERENKDLKSKLDAFQKRFEPQLISQGKSLFSSPLPREVSSLVEPGEWKRYKMDQWVQDPNQPNVWIRQVEIFEIIPPVAK